MYLVGIIENNDNKIKTRQIFENKIIIEKCTISKINVSNFNNFKSVKFDALIINSDISEMLDQENINKVLENTKIIILNIDYKANCKIVNNIQKTSVITYGFNKKATVTITSFDEGNIILEIQREIMSLNNIIVEEKEIQEEYKNR